MTKVMDTSTGETTSTGNTDTIAIDVIFIILSVPGSAPQNHAPEK